MASLVSAGTAVAETFPTKPITLIVPWPAGGATDIVSRAMAESASRHIGQPIVVENKAGASGTLGAVTLAASAKPDGYTIAQLPITVFRFPVMKDKKISWDPFKDFSYIVHMTGYTFTISALSDSKFKTWKDVIDYARANPGKLTYATTGAGTSLHIGMELIAGREKIQATHVPFKGGAEVAAALLGGHVDIAVEGTSLLSLIDAGKVRVLNVWTEQRLKRWPDAPTLRELGYPWVFDSPWGFSGPKGMDPAVVQKIHDAFKKALDDPKVLAVMEQYLMPVNYADPKGYLELVKQITAFEAEGARLIGLGKD
jgi:tripartite-type tricarboxylate transporter receptor subunit TctC